MLDTAGIKMKIAELEEAIKNDLPMYSSLLSTIHKETMQQPELIYKLDDAEIAVLISGLGKYHQVEITDPKDAKDAKITKKRGASMSEDDV